MTEPAVVTEEIARRFGDYWAVDGVDLCIDVGEIYGFLGPNGAGKSTLVRMLCTLMRPTRGRGVVRRARRGPRPGAGPAAHRRGPPGRRPRRQADGAASCSTCRLASTGCAATSARPGIAHVLRPGRHRHAIDRQHPDLLRGA